VAGSVGYESYEFFELRLSGFQLSSCRLLWRRRLPPTLFDLRRTGKRAATFDLFIKNRADLFNQIEIGLLIVASDIVGELMGSVQGN